jgi:hypothetical protein
MSRITLAKNSENCGKAHSGLFIFVISPAINISLLLIQYFTPKFFHPIKHHKNQKKKTAFQ